MKYSMLTMACSLFLTTLIAQSQLPQDLQVQFYKAYLSTNIKLWENGIKRLEGMYKEAPSNTLLLELVRANNGLIGSCFAKNDMDLAKTVVESADDLVDKLIKKEPKWAAPKAYKGGLLGYKISFSPMKGMWLGPKSSKLISKAIQLEADLARGWYQQGMSYLQTPETWGGDVKKAVECFAKAVDLMESQGNCLDNNWEYLDAMAWLGQAQTKAKQYDAAKQTYAKALDKEPLFGWVEYQLLPTVEKQTVGGDK